MGENIKAAGTAFLIVIAVFGVLLSFGICIYLVEIFFTSEVTRFAGRAFVSLTYLWVALFIALRQ
jgi:hypothetical protein